MENTEVLKQEQTILSTRTKWSVLLAGCYRGTMNIWELFKILPD